ncbi:MAG: DUF3298 and DUF4163 domain-containing protein [Halanaerobiales bacterium]
MRKRYMGKRCMPCRLVLFLGIFILLFSSVVICKEDIAGDISVYTLEYSLETASVNIELKIPVLTGLKDREVQEDFNLYNRDKAIAFADQIKEWADQDYYEYRGESGPFFKYQAYAAYEVKNLEGILSILMTHYEFTGGAHGMTVQSSYNLSPLTLEEVSFQDILELYGLELEEIKETIISEIEKEEDYYFSGAVDYVRDKNDFDYYIQDGHLAIYFQIYEIAPYVAGCPEFRITLY